MFFIILFLLVSVVNTQYYSQQQYPSNNYNSWLSNSQNYQPWNQGIQQNRAYVRGNLLSEDTSTLPYGSQIIVSIKDVSIQDVAAGPLNSVVLTRSYRFPIAFQIPYSIAQIQQDPNTARRYALQARIEINGQLLYINDQQIPVQLIPAPINPINIMLKKVGTPSYPGPDISIYPTRPPTIGGVYICQLRPDPGLCYASIEQYYFNTQSRSCQTFTWGGCGGNQNRFATRDACERTCSIYRRRILNNNAKQAPIG
ncbi:unnamed protein product [Adineta steineri]|uniref:BPTI/Kunitz inhibitor domain-containing protein n=1 Tax=Adineta steineri TaxID=433720 RepID=A0A814PB04_9BILA|nr:unnamed protein product [Adineta steineri]CAF1160467.1 unnamed protein product [Adineta steineri]CAF3708728.1 unnamed protein product [Adineta steineri]CAF4159379.1 unnamed protein product [Adineta steineri]